MYYLVRLSIELKFRAIGIECEDPGRIQWVKPAGGEPVRSFYSPHLCLGNENDLTCMTAALQQLVGTDCVNQRNALSHNGLDRALC